MTTTLTRPEPESRADVGADRRADVRADHRADQCADVRRTFHPSREQLRVAAAMFRVATEDVTSVVVPVVAPLDGAAGPVPAQGPASDGRLEYPGGYWLADRGSREGVYGYRAAREAAQAAAEAHLRSRGSRGVPGWVSIRPDGTWSSCDGA